MHKGYFPHLFNTPENQNKIFESHPDVDYYGHKLMGVKERVDFLKWHDAQIGVELNFQKELYKYCLDNGIDPLLNCER